MSDKGDCRSRTALGTPGLLTNQEMLDKIQKYQYFYRLKSLLTVVSAFSSPPSPLHQAMSAYSKPPSPLLVDDIFCEQPVTESYIRHKDLFSRPSSFVCHAHGF